MNPEIFTYHCDVFVCCKVAQNAIIFHQTCLLLCMTYKLLFIVDVYPGFFRRYFIDGFLHQGCSMMIDGGIIGEKGERPDYPRPTDLPSHHKTFPSKKAVWVKTWISNETFCIKFFFPSSNIFANFETSGSLLKAVKKGFKKLLPCNQSYTSPSTPPSTG